MTTKILVADDSATMRQVIAMTFGGEDARVVGVGSGEAALATARGDRPDIVLADASMTGMTGYELARAIRREGGLADVPVVLLSSQHHPYDEVLGKQCGVDDHISKPFDTQSLIDRVHQVLARPRPVGAVAAAPAPAPAPAPAVAMTAAAAAAASPAGIDPRRATMAFGAAGTGAAPPAARPAGPPPRPPAAPASGSMPLGRAPAAAPAGGPQVAPGGIVGGAPAARQAAPAAAPAAPAPAARVQEAPAAHAPAAAAAPAQRAAAAVSAATSGMDAKLTGEMGLTRDQADAVLKLSREVIEKVVWEVVPELAETMIREEIRRLTQEG